MRDGEEVGAALGARLGRDFARDARRLAGVAGLICITDDLRPRTMLYAPPLAAGGMGGVVLPADAPDDVAEAMLAVAAALHLDGTLRPTVYVDGQLVPMLSRHRAAHRFARAFLTAATARPRGIEVATARRRAG